MERYDFLVKLKIITKYAQSIAEKYLDLIESEKTEKNITDLLNDNANSLINEFTDSYSNLCNISDTTYDFEKTVAKFINDTVESLKEITLYSIFFKTTLNELNKILKLIEKESDGELVIASS